MANAISRVKKARARLRGAATEKLKDEMDPRRGKGANPELRKGRQMSQARDIDYAVPRRKD